MNVIDVLGMPASPYTRKILALMRYRQIPYRAIWGSHMDLPKGLPPPKVKLIPTIYLNTAAGKEALVDCLSRLLRDCVLGWIAWKISLDM
jgi:hypothetical protein